MFHTLTQPHWSRETITKSRQKQTGLNGHLKLTEALMVLEKRNPFPNSL